MICLIEHVEPREGVWVANNQAVVATVTGETCWGGVRSRAAEEMPPHLA